MQSLSELPLHNHIDKLIDSFATPCTAHFAIQLSLTEFRKRGLVINTRVRFIALVFQYIRINVHPMPRPLLSEGRLVTLFGDLEAYHSLMALRGSPASPKRPPSKLVSRRIFPLHSPSVWVSSMRRNPRASLLPDSISFVYSKT